MLVLDASAATELLLGRPSAAEIKHHLAGHNFGVHAPHLLDVEVMSALRRIVRLGQATPARAQEALKDLSEMEIHRYPHGPLVPKMWELRETVSAYDATYLSLAEVVGLPLLTTDARLASAATHTSVTVLLAG